MGPWTHGVDILSRALGLGSEGPCFRSALPGASGLCPRDRGVDQLSQATCAWLRYPAGSISPPGPLGPVSDGPQFRPALPGDTVPCPWDCGVNQLPSMTQASVLGPAMKTTPPARLTLWSEGPRG